ncbi:Activator of HSP90 ATPase (fragment) [Mesorhizobium delmotii]|uniref:Activator of HSP90 ATPase n=1 Tax=Mesorhizobium delmotii TaxID=1631247 RepID=A0A2P9APN9_9HYPH
MRESAAIDANEGFASMLAGAKAWLELGIELNLAADRFPDGLPPG